MSPAEVDRFIRMRLMARIVGRLSALSPLILGVIAWEICAFISHNRFLPHLASVIDTVWHSLFSDAMIEAQGGGQYGYAPHIWSTLVNFFICMIFGAGTAFSVAVSLYSWWPTRRALVVLLRPWHVVPPLIAIPLLLAGLGPTWVACRIAGCFYAFVATGIFVLSALDELPETHVFMARIAQAGTMWIAWRVRAVGILPLLVGPAKVTGSFTLGIVVVLEYLAAPVGIGRVMKFAISYDSVNLILAGIFWAALIGLSFGAALDWASNRFLRWAPRSDNKASGLTLISTQRLASR